MATPTYDSIASNTLASDSAVIEFTSIPNTYTDLVLVLRFNKNADSGSWFRINSDSGSNYSTIDIRSNGSSVASGYDVSQTIGRYFRGLSNAATNNLAIMQFMSYSNTGIYKTILTEAVIPGVGVERNVNLWLSNTAISSIQLITNTGVYLTGSTAELYGIKSS